MLWEPCDNRETEPISVTTAETFRFAPVAPSPNETTIQAIRDTENGNTFPLTSLDELIDEDDE